MPFDDGSIDAANYALLDGRDADALRSYFRELVDSPEILETIGLNISLARRRYRTSRSREQPKTAIIYCPSDNFRCANALADAIDGLLVSLGAKAPDESTLAITSTSGRDLPARTLDFILEHPVDIVRLTVPCAAMALVGLVYHMVWGAQIVYDLGDETEVQESNTDASFGSLATQWDDLCRADTRYLRLFPVATVSRADLAERFGGTLLSEGTQGFPVLPRAHLPVLGALLEDAAKDALDQFGGIGVFSGEEESRPPKRFMAEPDYETPYLVDIVVAVYNALDDVKACVESLKVAATTCRFRIILVNDGSGQDTTNWLRKIAAEPLSDHIMIDLHEHPENRGYTQAVNTGLRRSTAPYVVTLNSDTIVTDGWLEGLIRCIESAPEIGICGPLSNAASWQNVPELYAPDNSFAINALPEGMTPNDMAAVVGRASDRLYPRTTFVNGFCFMVTRAVIDAVGYMDDEAFPIGYGEENDYCIRAQDAGFGLAYADDTYVFHAKSKSFGSVRRTELAKAGGDAIRKKHSSEKFDALVSRVKDTTLMDTVRAQIHPYLAGPSGSACDGTWESFRRIKILFLLPVGGGSGGAHSVVQEVLAMRRIGVDAKVAVRTKNVGSFVDQYQDVPAARDVFLGFEESNLLEIASDFDVVIATIFTSVSLVKNICEALPWIIPAYYVQDYEPLFFDPEQPEWKVAYDSYQLVPGMVCFAKTDWICKTVERFHGVRVAKVRPSIDHDVYTPDLSIDAERGNIRIAAMIRPQTPRRGAGRTMELLKQISRKHGDKVTFSLFGCDPKDAAFLELERDFPFVNHGVLLRPGVAALLQKADIFIDLSDYQAFGRTALEAMACGAVSLVPEHGGSDEYAVDGENALVVDTLDPVACFSSLDSIVSDPQKLSQMRIAAIETANRYSVRRAALSELTLLAEALSRKRRVTPVPKRSRVCLLPSRTKGSQIAGSGYVRLVMPYTQDGLLAKHKVTVSETSALPAPYAIDTVIIQRDLPEGEFEKLQDWMLQAKTQGIRMIYEIDDDLLDAVGLRARGYPGDTDALARRVRTYLKHADLVTTSTHRLAELFSDYRHKTVVVPNLLDMRLWQQTVDQLRQKRLMRGPVRPVRIGYFGTPTHYEDMRIVEEPMKELKKRFGDRIEIEVIGAFQNETPLFGRRIGLPQNNFYPNFVTWLSHVVDWDIGIIPLKEDRFNLAKSNLKFLEYAATGVATVCSDNEEYRRIARHEENCLLVNNTDADWLEAISRLVEDAELRQRLATKAQEELLEKYTVQANVGRYRSVLED